ncbi:MAG: hypothetical protein QM733_10340 [Ilumatobacteraceae bacterium]
MDEHTNESEQLIIGRRPCSWCTKPVTIVCRPGRPKLYCNHACRQRAYEHRHGFCHQRVPRLLPGQADDDQRPPLKPTDATGYECGGISLLSGKLHAMRPSVRPEGRRRETLCGLLQAPNGRRFSRSRPDACLTCSSIATKHPLRHTIDASNELARLRAVIDEAVEQRHPPAAALAWLHGDAPPRIAA